MSWIENLIRYLTNIFKFWIIVQSWESGIRVRGGKYIKKLNAGFHFKIPHYDSVFIQETRLRVLNLSMQTLTTKDGKTITVSGSIGYKITDVEKLYDTIYQPEMTIGNLALGTVGKFISDKHLEYIDQEAIEENILLELNKTDYGLEFTYYRITTFAVVRTYRIIKDSEWFHEGLDMNKSK